MIVLRAGRQSWVHMDACGGPESTSESCPADKRIVLPCSSVSQSRPVVGVTFGNFDSFHLGHQALVARLLEELSSEVAARASTETGPQALPVLATFKPHPRQFFRRISPDAVRYHEDLWPVVSWRRRFSLAMSLGVKLFYQIPLPRSWQIFLQSSFSMSLSFAD